MARLSVEQFDQLYAAFEHSVWRWEAQPEYHEPGEAEPFRRWQAGEPDDLAWLADWLATLRSAAAAGRTFARARLYREPPTDYQRWGLEIARANVAAGEDVRIVSEHAARPLELPGYDFCIFDDRLLARMHFGEHGFIGADATEDPAELARHRAYRADAWHHALTLEQYRAAQASPRSP